MKHYLLLFKRTFSISVSTMLVYRANIVFFLIFESLFLASQFLTVSVGYDLAQGAIAGWTREQAMVLTAINALTHQVFICFFINPVFSLGIQVWDGQFDYILLKPLRPLATMFFTGQFVVSNLPNLLINGGVVAYLLATASQPFPWVLWPTMLLCLATGVAVRVGLALLCVAPAFLSERLTDIEGSFWGLASLGRYPLAVYPRAMEMVLTYAVPLGMLGSVPASLVFQKDGLLSIGLACMSAVLFAVVSGMVFMRALKRYQSVNSGV